jgi:hypothetical protein
VPSKYERPRGRAAGVSEDDKENGRRVAQAAARKVQLRDLAARDDWREAVNALRLPEREAHLLVVDVLRLRNFAATDISSRARARPSR